MRYSAVVRIGMNQLQGLLMVAHLRSKIMGSGAFETEAALLSALSLPLGHLARELHRELEGSEDGSFTRGLLMHVEHFVIMGALSDISKDQRRKLHPSPEALLDAFQRFGPQIRNLVAGAWKVEEILMDGEEYAESFSRFEDLRRAYVYANVGCGYAGEPDWISPVRLSEALETVSSKSLLPAATA